MILWVPAKGLGHFFVSKAHTTCLLDPDWYSSIDAGLYDEHPVVLASPMLGSSAATGLRFH